MKNFVIKLYCIVFFIFLLPSFGFAETTAAEPPSLGYFALPVAQQPGPFVSFGQGTIGANALQIYLYPSYLKVKRGYYYDYTTALLYGVTDTIDLLLTLPIALDYVQGPFQSSGLADASMQFEYAFYQKSTAVYSEQATFVSGLSLPSGSIHKLPPTGYGAPSFFEGLTFNRTYVNWMVFFSPGAIITTSNDGNYIGNSVLYQLGIGRLLSAKKDHHIIAALVELNGEWDMKSRFLGVRDLDSGGNVLYITPSLWYSNKRLILQAGFSIPLTQQLNGIQPKNEYYALISVGWTFF